MYKNIEKKIFDYLSQHLSYERCEHSCNVATLAVKLASVYNENMLKAQIAGLLHDCAKYMTNESLINFFKKNNEKFEYFCEIIRLSPYLLHSFAGEVIAIENFKIKDKDILNAIRNHTLGRENMSVLEKIIFVADSTSYDRKWGNAEKMRNLAKKDLDKAFLKILKRKMKYVINNGIFLCHQAVSTWNYYASNT
ncbi:MAG: bis(5'-nucleosyl)-tetraphosphatase (symmetrical) YqeK [Endomicrobiia bacterium]|nr:MAG: bis(5'-nucleosyl)-tetraphosphatase (symmetrical) YqeK [Endomicrobiia bacterium]